MILMWSCPGNMPKYYPGLRDILPFGRVICLLDLGNILTVTCQNITVPNITTETYTKYNNTRYKLFEEVTIKCLYIPWLSVPSLQMGIFLIIYIRRGRNRMVVGFTTTYTINAYHH
jgi:hypothetical protein